MPNYLLLSELGEEGPYTDVELMDLLDRDLISREMTCQETETGELQQVGDLFVVIHPEQEEEAEKQEEEHDLEEPEEPEAEAEAAAAEDIQPPVVWRPWFSYDKMLQPGEAIYYTARTSWLMYWPALVLAGGSFVAGLWGMQKQLIMAMAGWGGAMVVMVVAWLLRSRCVYIVTTFRVESVKGWIVQSSREIRIQDIRTINVLRSGMLKSLFGIGTVEFSSAASADGEVKFENISRCANVKMIVRSIQG